MTPHRIAYVLNVFPKISETFIAAEIAELRRRGVEVRALSLRAPADELRHAIIARSRLEELVTYGRDRFARVLREFRPQLVHAHFATEPTAAARTLAREHGVPFTFTAHGYDVYRRPPRDWAERAAAAAAVITVSEANARHIIESFAVPRARLRVIPCGVDTRRFRPGPRPPEPPHVVAVGRLRPVKNFTLLLEACETLRERAVEFRCVIVGDGECRGTLEAARQRRRLEHHVELAGAADDEQVRAWWQRATIAVLPSLSEGMPVSLMEAAACGVPAVATAVGGIPELIDDGATGRLVRSGDAAALSAALEWLLARPDAAERWGRAARRRVEDRFSLRLQVDRLLALWTQVLAAGEVP